MGGEETASWKMGAGGGWMSVVTMAMEDAEGAAGLLQPRAPLGPRGLPGGEWGRKGPEVRHQWGRGEAGPQHCECLLREKLL